jgi:hypothetical protein
MSDEPVEKTGMDVGDLVPVFGLCCTISSLYLEWPQCVGCSGKGVCICYEGEGARSPVMTRMREPSASSPEPT